MKDKKITFKYFSIAEYEKEEAYLRKMHQQGWKLVKISLRYLYVRAYIFEKCQPEDVIYRTDYDQTGGDAYIQMFADCGWEYLFDFDESSYFRKKKEDIAEDEDIFCDDVSRLAMVRRVFKARIYSLSYPLRIRYYFLDRLGFTDLHGIRKKRTHHHHDTLDNHSAGALILRSIDNAVL